MNIAFIHSPKFLPVVMMALSLGAAMRYFCAGDLRHGFYWVCAAGITAAVTF